MAENKKSFVLYSDQKSIIDMLPDELAGKLLKHIYAYVNDENPVTDNPMVALAFEPIKLQLKRDLVKWDEIKEVRSKAGIASAEARRNKAAQTQTNPTHVDFVQQTPTNPTVNDNVTVNVNDNVTVINIEPKSSIEYDFEKIKTELKENQYTTKQFVIQQYKLTLDQYLKFVDIFVGEKDNDLHKPLDEVLKHFKNWCRTNHVKLKKDFTTDSPPVAAIPKKMIH